MDVVAVFFAGLAVSLTPCVYPLLPVTVAAIAGANPSGEFRNGFFLSLVYVLGLALSYTSLGILASLTGKVFGAFQNSMAALFVVGSSFFLFSLMMFDLVRVPAISGPGPWRGRGALALLGMGLVAGLVVGPCTAPVLGGLLLHIASRKNVLFGGGLLFVFSLGMGMLPLLAGTFSGFLSGLPKPGPWMTQVKRGIGIFFFLAAVYYFLRAFQIL